MVLYLCTGSRLTMTYLICRSQKLEMVRLEVLMSGFVRCVCCVCSLVRCGLSIGIRGVPKLCLSWFEGCLDRY
jgi:hypothetical protein